MRLALAIVTVACVSGSDRKLSTIEDTEERRGSTVVEGSVADESFTRVRSTVPYMMALVREGYDRSPSFRELVHALQQTNVIVLVQPGPCAGGRIRSCLVSVNGSLQERQIRIKVDAQHTIRDRLIATVAHELQHAVEIAEHSDVIDAAGALQLYRRIGLGRCREGLSEECETARALATEKKVLDELSHGPEEPSWRNR